jgi:DNA-binding NarL/FixJ family response regulator
MTVRVLIADDHYVVRAGIAAMFIGTEFEVTAQATNCRDAVRFTATCAPDIVVLDLSLPDGSGLAAAQRIKSQRPGSRLVVLTAAAGIPAMVQAYDLGVDGYLVKGVTREKFLDTLRKIADGRSGWTRRQLRQIGTAKRHRYGLSPCVGLTEREVQVLSRIVAGMSNDEIAEDLNVDVETVKQHVKALLRKLGLVDRTQAAIWAVHGGMEPQSGVQGTPPAHHV